MKKLIIAIFFLFGLSFCSIRIEQKAEKFMDYANKKKIRAGLLYYKSDTLITKRNY